MADGTGDRVDGRGARTARAVRVVRRRRRGATHRGRAPGRSSGVVRFARHVRRGRLGRAVAARARAVRRGVPGVPADAGMATAEYAIVMIAAVGFAGLLVVILTSPEIREALTSLVRGALSV